MSVTTLTRPAIRPTPTRTVTVTFRLPWDPDLSIPQDPDQLVDLLKLLVSRGADITTDANPTPHPVSRHPLAELAGCGVAQTPSPLLHQPPMLPAPDGQLRIDTQRRTVQRGTQPVALTRIEFDLLLFLTAHRPRVFTRRQLLDEVWRTTDASTRTVDVHIRRLRAKLGQDHPLMITIRSVGYRLDDNADVVIVHPDGHT